ncbi:MAG: hypothetical protein U0U70_17545 [Chitinophagaceae bacterium]
MKPQSTLFLLAVMAAILVPGGKAAAQQYKLKQTSSTMGMKSETTIYVKGMRKRTEGGGMMGMTNNLVTIEQCDKQRTITINDKKKMYCIEPFVTVPEETDEDTKPAVKPKAQPVTTKNGGVIHTYYNITDTGERKKMYGFTARHVWTTQKMKPSPDACMMKDSMIIKTDGWYIDLPQFNCPVHYTPPPQARSGDYQKPDCKDQFVSHRSGKGKLGFPLIEKRTIIMGGGPASMSEFVTELETIELTTEKLDSMLFEIPPGYTEAKDCSELQEKMDVKEMIKGYTEQARNGDLTMPVSNQKRPGVMRIGVMPPKADEQVQPAVLQQHLAGILLSDKVEAVPVSSEEDARGKNCDYLLNTDFVKLSKASKVGGLLKAIKNADPNAASSYNIDANLVLTSLADGSVRTQQNVSGKYEGKPDDAANRALDEGGRLVLKALK